MKAPKAPDPWETAKAQQGLNKETAQAQQQANMINQKTPFGSLNYTQVGTWADGTPRYEGDQQLSPELQGIVDKTLNGLGGPLQDKEIDPNISNEETESRLMELGRKRLDPLLAERRESTEQQLYNRGARAGSEAYDREMNKVAQGENDAWNELLLNGRDSAFNQELTNRKLESELLQQQINNNKITPFNQAMGLLSGGTSAGINTPQTGVSGVDYQGAVNNNYNNKVSQRNAGLGGLAGLGTSLLGLLSDERAKTDIKPVGRTFDGRVVYTYRYKGHPATHMGIMAQENPDIAFMDKPSGYLKVDYSKIGTI